MRIVFCSAPRAEAKGLAREIIARRLAACVQIVGEIESVYWWKGQVCEDEEALLLCKTDASKVEELTAAIRELHSYQVPEVIAVEVKGEEGNRDYLSWLLQEVRGSASD